MDNPEDWYSRLTQYTSEKGRVGLPDLESLKPLFVQGLSVEEAFDQIYPPLPTVYDNTTGLEPSHQLVAGNDQMSTQDLVVAVQADRAPHVTEAQVLAKVVRKTFTLLPEGRSILCEITMVNGAVFHGTSTPVSNQSLDVSQSQTRALTKAIQQAWDREGYLLREQLYQAELAKIAARTVGIGNDTNS